MTFESDYNYPIAEMTKISDLQIGQEVYYLFNSDNKVNCPQFFKSKVGSLKGDSALFDSVFNLKHKKKKLNFLFLIKIIVLSGPMMLLATISTLRFTLSKLLISKRKVWLNCSVIKN
ncbi:hypothetical protein CPX_001613 [Candidatus Phytoplasma pruni]|uniref:Uncharacterized protein n=1 Tax=Candidatus Phytoplasma pruni TaxID=479893 RepID=A0A0M1N045_9MOLU|nr:hypothetical protein CPX_001613 [Candidatus Phytoplasma pruni]